jgi:hypothetical protein
MLQISSLFGTSSKVVKTAPKVSLPKSLDLFIDEFK